MNSMQIHFISNHSSLEELRNQAVRAIFRGRFFMEQSGKYHKKAGAVLFSNALTILLVWLAGSSWLLAQTAAARKATVVDVPQLTVVASKSILINTQEPIGRVAISAPEVADVLVVSPNQTVIHGKAPGIASILLWDRAGKSTSYDLVVELDTSLVQQQIEAQFPTENIQVSSAKGAIVLSGMVSEPKVAEKAVEISANFSQKVVNLLHLPPAPDTEQILLQVKFADVDRMGAEKLGINIFSTGAGNTLGSISTQQFSPVGNWDLKTSNPGTRQFSASQGITDALNIFGFRFDANIGITIKALQEKNLLQILAEPNLIASNGKEASFLAGGEFPFPMIQSSGGVSAVTVTFKEFGVRLNFTPTITPSGKIRLKVKPEVSALDFTNAVSVNGFFVPAISTRRAETEVELADGQSFAIAGLIDNRVTEVYNKIPGLGDLPVIGYLFKSRSQQKSKTELMVMVTPKLVKPLNPDQLPAMPEGPKSFLDLQKFDGKAGTVDRSPVKAAEPGTSRQ
jgi:pilus assembly protein CpaC